MKFMRRLMDALKMDGTREFGNNSRENSEKESIYHDRFDEEYRKVDTYREIKFNGRNFDIPEIQVCATLLLNQNRKGGEIGKDDNYSRYYEGKYGIVNISKLHKWLYKEGYLRDATLPEAMELYKVPELKTMLESLGLKKTGKKSDLIERVISALNDTQKIKIVKDCNQLFLSDKGKMFLDENYDFVLFHRSQYDISLNEFLRYRFAENRKRTFNDTAYQILTERAYTYQLNKYFSKLEMVYWNLSNICDNEGNGELALRYALYRLYFSANLASHPYYFDVDLIKFNGIKKTKEQINGAEIFNEFTLNRITKYKVFYGGHVLDIIYDSHILPYGLFNKTDMEDAIQDLYEGIFDTEHYTNYIRTNYGNYIKKYL